MPNPLARCINAAGNKSAGTLLYRLFYWIEKTKIERDGKTWVVLSREQWMVDTASTQSEVDRAIATLKSSGLIDTEKHLFGNKMRVFMRPSARAHLLKNANTDVLKNAKTGVLKNEKFLCISENKKGDKEVSGEPLLASFSEANVKVSEVLAAQAAKKHIHKPDTTKQLEFVWKETFAEVYESGLVHLTGKQLGQLKHFLGKCPEGKAATILEWAIRNWIEFVKDVETKAGVKTTPSYPSIDFLLKHAWVAVELATSSNKKLSPPKKQEASGDVLSAQGVQLISQEEQPQSLEELMAILGDKPEK